MRSAPLAAAVACIAPLLNGPQESRNLSGTWTRTFPPLSAGEQLTERIDLTGDQLTVVTDRQGVAGPLGYRSHIDHTYNVGGPMQSKKDADGRVRSVAVSWEGARLVFIRTATEGANTTVDWETWSLSDDGSMLTIDRRTTDWRGSSTERLLFRRCDGKSDCR